MTYPFFPVTWGSTRKLRFRYLIPAQTVNGKNKFGYPHAFTSNAIVKIKKGYGVSAYEIGFSNSPSLSISQNLFFMDNTEYSLQYFSKNGLQHLDYITPHLKNDLGGSLLYIGNFEMPGMRGEMMKLVAKAPKSMLERLAEKYENNFTLDVTLTNNTDSITKPVKVNLGTSDVYYEIRAYSNEPIRNGVLWTVKVNNAIVDKFVEMPTVIHMIDGIQYARVMGAHTFYPMASTMPVSMASTLGFIDEKYALLALEEDVLDFPLSFMYRQRGVPGLHFEDIFPEEADIGFVSSEKWLQENPVVTTANDLMVLDIVKLAEAGIRFHISNGILTINIADWRLAQNEPITIVIYDIRGNIVAESTINWINNVGQITWNPKKAGLVTGMYLLRITSADVNVTKSILVK